MTIDSEKWESQNTVDKMEKVTAWASQFTGQCPHCGKHIVGFGWSGGRQVWVIVCPNAKCGRFTVLFTAKATEGRRAPDPYDWYPKVVPKCTEEVPPDLAEDYIEAQKCLGVNARKAAATMARRFIQGILVHVGASPDKPLFEQVEDLVKNGKLLPQLGRLAHSIRLLGNVGAHPSQDGLDDVSRDDAEAMLGFADRLIEELFLTPKKLDDIESKVKPRRGE